MSRLRQQGELLATAAAASPWDTPIPTCPGWTQRDVVQHLGRVHRWACEYVVRGRTEPVGLAKLEQPPAADAELAGWFRAGVATLADGLAAAPADLACWHFLPAPSPLAFWARRQAHETAMHRADVEGAIGAVTPVDPEFAVDGVDELLLGFLVRAWRMRTDRPRTLLLRATDTGDEWSLRLGPQDYSVSRTPDGAPADCTVRGPAAQLYLLVWNREGEDGAGLDVDGDRALLAQWRESAQVNWS